MPSDNTGDLLTGAVEGFYGPPWSQAERCELFDWMAEWGLNTYLYAPKDDLKHRVLWREPYSAAEAEGLGDLIHACSQRSLTFIYALSPGLDIRYGDEAELEHLRRRFSQMLALGCRHFGLLFDDVPDRPDTAELVRAGKLATAQCEVANRLFDWTHGHYTAARFLFCPAPYCGRMAAQGVGGPGYLETIGRELRPNIDVLWTGPEIISREISVAHVREVRSKLQRKPLLWDNLHANDYDGRRFFCGPYSGRSLALRDEISGILANPNNEFPLNYVPLRTLAGFVHCDQTWNPRQAYLAAMHEWVASFATVSGAVDVQDLIRFGDCYYLPYEEGEEAQLLYERAQWLVATEPAQWGREAVAFLEQTTRLRAFCGQMAALCRRSLFHALCRRLWELREELDLVELYVRDQFKNSSPSAPFRSDFHLRGTYRGGLVARMQRVLVQQKDGSFTPAADLPSAESVWMPKP